MVIEHTFITTLEANEALSTASDMLRAGGFEVINNPAFQMGGWTDLELSRGRKSVARAKNVTQCPQQVRLEWDRGRVNVAASITPSRYKNRAFRWSGRVNGQAYPGSGASKRERAYADLMLSITRSLESLLANRLPPDQARAEWAAVETQMVAEAKRARRRDIIIRVVIIAGFFALLMWFAWYVSPHRRW